MIFFTTDDNSTAANIRNNIITTNSGGSALMELSLCENIVLLLLSIGNVGATCKQIKNVLNVKRKTIERILVKLCDKKRFSSKYVKTMDHRF